MRGKSHLVIGTLATLELALIKGFYITPITMATAAFLSVAPDMDEPNSRVLNRILSKNMTKKLHSLFIYLILILSFYFYTKTNNNIYVCILVSLLTMFFFEKNVPTKKFRSVMITAFMFMVALVMFLLKVNPGITFLTFLLACFPLMKHRSFSHSIFMVVLIFFLLRYIEDTMHIKDLANIGAFAYSTHLICDMVTIRGIPLFYPVSRKYYNIGRLRVGTTKCNTVETMTTVILLGMIFASIVSGM